MSNLKPVADPGNSYDHLRILGREFQLLTQACDVHVDGTREGPGFMAPDLLKQFIARKDNPWVLREIAQQVKLPRGEDHGFTVVGHLRSPSIQNYRSELMH